MHLHSDIEENGRRSQRSHRKVCIRLIKKLIDAIIHFRFYASGGWAILNSWLTESKKTHNSALSIHLLELLRKLPVTVDMLKLVRNELRFFCLYLLIVLSKGTVGKLVKQLSKAEQACMRRYVMICYHRIKLICILKPN